MAATAALPKQALLLAARLPALERLPTRLRVQEELGHLKSLWDMVAAVLHTFHAWSGTLWGAINVEGLMEECKQMTKDMKQLPKPVSRPGQRAARTAGLPSRATCLAH